MIGMFLKTMLQLSSLIMGPIWSKQFMTSLEERIIFLVLPIQLSKVYNLVVEKSISNSEEFKTLLHKVRDVVKYFKRSTSASDELRKLQINEGKMNLILFFLHKLLFK